MTFSKIIFLVKNLKNVFFITKNLIALDKIWEKFAKTFALTVSANVIPVFLIYPFIKRGHGFLYRKYKKNRFLKQFLNRKVIKFSRTRLDIFPFLEICGNFYKIRESFQMGIIFISIILTMTEIFERRVS